MTDPQSAAVSSNHEIYRIHWHSSDDEVIAQMNGLIGALQNKDVEATTILPSLCKAKIVSTWLSLLLTLASSEGVTDRSLVSSFTKHCGGCMVYSILMAVGCFHSDENIKLAFDFFRHVLADPTEDILELQEVSELSLLLVNTIASREDGTFMRQVCLELHCYNHIRNISDTTKKILEGLFTLIEGLGAICTSKSFVNDMKGNPTCTKQILKEALMNKTFSYDFVTRKWP